MASSALEYWNGSSWVVEANLLSYSLKDNLQEPMELEALIANFSSSALNTRETNYGKFTKVRLKERYSNKYIFYGKILVTHPSRDSQFGHIVQIRALDNLRELATKTANVDITNQTTRSGLVSTLISNHTWSTGSTPNIAANDSTKFKTSTVSESSGVLNKTYTGDRKKLLDIIQSIASSDPVGSVFGYDFYLDTEFSGNTATPDLFYFPRGSIPAGTMPASGLTIEYAGTPSDQVISMAGDYHFNRQSSELKTRAVVRWVDLNNKPRKTDCILINHGATSGGNFDIDDTITWSGSGSAKVLLVGSTNRWVVIGPDVVDVDDKESNSNWLNSISGLAISGGGASATVNSATANPPGSLREAIESEAEIILQAYDISTTKAAAVHAAGILYSAGDTITRGTLNVYQYPQYTIKGTHTGSSGASSLTDSSKTFTNLGIFKGEIVKNTTDDSQATITSVSGTNIGGTLSSGTENDWDNGDTYEIPIIIRAGHVIYVKGIPSDSGISNQSVLVTQIEYNEGPGLQLATIRVALHSDGRASIPRSPTRNNSNNTNIAANVPANDQSGIKPLGIQNWTTSIVFTNDGTNKHNTVDWTGATIYFFDGTNFSINSGTTGAISAVTYIYFAKSSPTVLQTTTSASTAQGPDNIVLATCENVTSPGTVTIETTTGVAQKNYYSMDTLFDGAQYGRIQAGNLLSGWLNLGAANNAGYLDLDKTAESSTRKHVNADQKDGGGRAFAGLTSTGYLTREQVLNNSGLSFRTAAGTSYLAITGDGIIGIGAGADQFQIQAGNGVAGFGGNIGSQASPNYPCTLSSTGLTITGGKLSVETAGSGSNRITITSAGIKGINSSNVTLFQLQSSDGKGKFGYDTNASDFTCILDNEGVKLGVNKTDGSTNGLISFESAGSSTNRYRITNYLGVMQILADNTFKLRPSNQGGWNFGDDCLYWGYIWNKSYKIFRAAGSPATFSTLESNSAGDLLWNGSAITSGGSGTVTSVATSGAITGGTITSTGTITHSTSAPYKHIPSGGASSQVLTYSSSGTATWQASSAHGTHLTFWSDVGTGPLYPLSASGQDIGTPTNGVKWLHIENAYGIKTNYNNSATTIWETHGHHEFEADVYIKAGNKLTCESELVVDTGSANAPGVRFDSSLTSGLFYDSGVFITVSGVSKIGASSSINYNYQKVYVSNMDSTSGGVYVKWESGMLKQQSSTERAKMNIRDLEIDSSKIYDLVTKSFEFRTPIRDETDNSVVDVNGRLTYTDVPESTSFGLIAEAVNELVPELVLSAADDGIPDAVDYPLLSVLVLAELKKLRSRIEVLEGN